MPEHEYVSTFPCQCAACLWPGGANADVAKLNADPGVDRDGVLVHHLQRGVFPDRLACSYCRGIGGHTPFCLRPVFDGTQKVQEPKKIQRSLDSPWLTGEDRRSFSG